MENVKGSIISRNETMELLSQPVGIRIRQIRLKLDGMYPGEFNLKKVADELGLSENGLAKIEKGNTNVQEGTVDLSEKYFARFNVPLGFFQKKPASSMKPFYLGKEEDMLPYFNRFYEANGQKHFLDDRELPQIDNDGDYPYYDPTIDVEGWDVSQDENGEPVLNQLGVEINLSVYQVSTKQLLWVKRLNQMAVISPNELQYFEKALCRDVEVIVKQYSQMYALQEQLQDSQTRQSLLEMQIALKDKDQKSESDSALERLIGTLLKS
ncbi:helix-turn-helix domain-containing protein [Paenibacillus lactis]|uniref:helix-turn-helix domain-containing protein n=1 Tax=Paenibacillus TaxID=44249 RepID=UPI00119F202A|nr:helix-turn-helix transcriptional regulator [Paenibacillus sp. IHBB 10380]